MSAAARSALLDVLASDTVLAALAPDGTYLDQAPHGAQRFVLVKQLGGESFDAFGGRSHESVLFLVTAVEKNTDGSNASLASERIDDLLRQDAAGLPAALSAACATKGVGLMATRRVEPVAYAEADDVEPADQWQHRGGQYELWTQPAA